MKAWKGRIAIAARLAYLIDVARTRGLDRPMPTRETLARQLRVDVRTITRDLAAMEEAHIAFRRADGHD